MSKPFTRTPAKIRQDAAKLRNLTGAPIPGGTLTDFRPPKTTAKKKGA